MKDAGSEWNKWLLMTPIPDLYLSFLEDLGRLIGYEIFKFWPPLTTCENHISNIICESFWAKLPSSLCALFPRAHPVNDSTTNSKRTNKKRELRQSPTLFEI